MAVSTKGGYETTGGSLDAWQTWGNTGGNVAVSDVRASREIIRCGWRDVASVGAMPVLFKESPQSPVILSMPQCRPSYALPNRLVVPPVLCK